jgi:hypothetical protein
MAGSVKGVSKSLAMASIILAAGFLISLGGFPGSILAVTSSSGHFNATPDTTYFNWTSGSILVTSLGNNTSFYIDNATTGILSNYSQADRYTKDDYPYIYDDINWNSCFNTTGGPSAGHVMKFLVQNVTGDYTNTTGVLNQMQNATLFLTPYLFCPPGKYYGSFRVYNLTNLTDNLMVNAVINIPVSVRNTYSEGTHTAFFRGSLSSQNPSHIYYINKTLPSNVTSMYINLTWLSYSNSVDMFLFNGSSLMSKSIERSSSEGIYSPIQDLPEMAKVIVYGNLSENYWGNISFSTLNSSAQSLSFGSLGPNQTANSSFVLSNADDSAVSNVNKNVEVYHFEQWNGSSSSTYRFIVPGFAERLKVAVNWTNTSNRWSIALTDPSGSAMGNSSDRYLNANVNGVEMEEFVEFSGPFNTTNDGYWMINVTNQTNATLDQYTVKAYIWLGSSWVGLNYTNGFNFSSFGLANSSLNITVNVTAMADNMLNGSYRGFISFYNGTGWKYRIPIDFNVLAASLMVNDTFESTSYYYKDNTGFNRVGLASIQAHIIYNNTGGYPVYYTMNTSDYRLNNSASYINFTVGALPNPIVPGGNGTIDINFTIDTNKTVNTQGIYSGWIFLNATNATLSSSSYPFSTFNITLQINLTNQLNVTMTSINPEFVTPVNQSNSVTATFQVRLANGTIISDNGVMHYTNFTSLYLVETNITTQTITLANISAGPGGGSGCSYPSCLVNATVPANQVGGRYNLYGVVSWNTSLYGGTGEVNLAGTAYRNNVSINDTGVYMVRLNETYLGEITEGYSTYFYVYLANYGPVASDGLQITFDKSSCYISTPPISYNTAGSCAGATFVSSGNASTYNVTMPAYFAPSTACWVRWQVIASTVTEDKACNDAKVRVFNRRYFGNGYEDITFTVKNDVAAANDSGAPSTGQATCTTNANCVSTKYCSNGQCVAVSCPSGYISNHACVAYTKKLEITNYTASLNITQGQSGGMEVSVKNTGSILLTGKLVITTDTSKITASISPTMHSLNTSVTGIFILNFSVAGDATVGYHKVTAKAYNPDNTSVSDSKEITITVLPKEETKSEINEMFLNYTEIFDALEKDFSKILSGSVNAQNYTKTNRTYSSIINILSQIEESISTGDYVKAYGLLGDANATISRFQQEISQLSVESQQTSNFQVQDMWTWAAVGIVIIVIIAFLVYLLMPPKEGYSPLLGFKPKRENPVKAVFSKISGHLGALHHHVKKQMKLKQFFGGEAAPPVSAPSKLPKPGKQASAASYMQGYSKVDIGKKKNPVSRLFGKLKKK